MLLYIYLVGVIIITALIKIFPNHVPKCFVVTEFKNTFPYSFNINRYERAGLGSIAFWPVFIGIQIIYLPLVILIMFLDRINYAFMQWTNPKPKVKE